MGNALYAKHQCQTQSIASAISHRRGTIRIGYDRGFSILSTTLVERSLARAIALRLPGAKDHYSRLFDNDEMLSTLDARITLGEVMGIIGTKTKRNLNAIKHIRNTFAHAAVPITFDTPEITEACGELVLDDDAGVTDSTGRFHRCCTETSIALPAYSQAILDHFGDADVTQVTFATVLTCIPPPLP
jgi:hypothetical protein